LKELVPELVIANHIFNKNIFDPNDDGLEIWYDGNSNACAYGREINNEYYFKVPRVGIFKYNPIEDLVLFYDDRCKDKNLIEDSYYRLFLPIVLHLKGIESLHASGFQTEKGVIALAGVSGVGKSTLAYYFKDRGFELWGDDSIAILENGNDRFVTVGLPFKLRTKEDNNDLKKNSFEDLDNFKNCEKSISNILSIIELVRVEKHGEINLILQQLTPSETVKVLLKHAYYFSLRNEMLKKRMVSKYFKIANSIPTYRLTFVPEKKNIPVLVNEIIKIIH